MKKKNVLRLMGLIGLALSLWVGVQHAAPPPPRDFEELWEWYKSHMKEYLAVADQAQPFLDRQDWKGAEECYLHFLPPSRQAEEEAFQEWQRTGGKVSRFRVWQAVRNDTDSLLSLIVLLDSARRADEPENFQEELEAVSQGRGETRKQLWAEATRLEELGL